MFKPIYVGLLALSALTVSGCGADSRIEQLESELAELKMSMASTERLELVEKNSAEGDEKCVAEMSESLAHVMKENQQAHSIAQKSSVKAANAENLGMIAVEYCKQNETKVEKLSTSVEMLRQEQKDSLRQVEVGFGRRLAETDQKFQKHLALLETQFSGEDTELSSLVDKELQEMQSSVHMLRSELMEKLAEEHEHTQKIETENAGYKASLATLFEQNQNLETGFKKRLQDAIEKMNEQYDQDHNDLRSLEARVLACEKPISQVILIVTSVIAEFCPIDKPVD